MLRKELNFTLRIAVSSTNSLVSFRFFSVFGIFTVAARTIWVRLAVLPVSEDVDPFRFLLMESVDQIAGNLGLVNDRIRVVVKADRANGPEFSGSGLGRTVSDPGLFLVEPRFVCGSKNFVSRFTQFLHTHAI